MNYQRHSSNVARLGLNPGLSDSQTLRCSRRDPGPSIPSLESSPVPAGEKQPVTSQVRLWASQMAQRGLGRS